VLILLSPFFQGRSRSELKTVEEAVFSPRPDSGCGLAACTTPTPYRPSAGHRDQRRLFLVLPGPTATVDLLRQQHDRPGTVRATCSIARRAHLHKATTASPSSPPHRTRPRAPMLSPDPLVPGPGTGRARLLATPGATTRVASGGRAGTRSWRPVLVHRINVQTVDGSGLGRDRHGPGPKAPAESAPSTRMRYRTSRPRIHTLIENSRRARRSSGTVGGACQRGWRSRLELAKESRTLDPTVSSCAHTELRPRSLSFRAPKIEEAAYGRRPLHWQAPRTPGPSLSRPMRAPSACAPLCP